MKTINRSLFVTLMTVTVTLLNACAMLGPYKESPRVSLVRIQPQEMGVLEQRYGLQLRSLNYRLSGKISQASSPASLPFDYSDVLEYQPAAKAQY